MEKLEKGKREEIESEPGSGPLGAVAQASWLGQPSQESDFPADSDWGPGQSEYLLYSATKQNEN